MSTEKEINDAIAIVQEAAIEGRLQIMGTGYWVPSHMHKSTYRAKPDPVERWFVYDIEEKSLTEFHNKETAQIFANSCNYPCRAVHLREVEE